MKRTRFHTRFAIVLAFGFMLIVFSCKKDKSEAQLTPQEEEQISIASSESEAESDGVYNDVFDNVIGVNNEVGLQGTGIFGGRAGNAADGIVNGRETNVDSLPACVHITITHLSTTSFFPVKIVTNFGSSGCIGRDGHARFGKIISVYTGRLTEPGKKATTTFDGYKLDSISIEGTHTIANTSTPGTLQRQFTMDVQNGKLTHPNGNYSACNSHRVITQVEGLATPLLPADDVFTITGYSNGVVKKGNLITYWESKIIEPLRKRFACRWISKGTVRIIRKNLPDASPWIGILDYGQGVCDNHATLTINGITHQITLH